MTRLKSLSVPVTKIIALVFGSLCFFAPALYADLGTGAQATGYYWLDGTAQANYSWVEISTNTDVKKWTRTPDDDDDTNITGILLGFDFSFFGVTKSSVCISNNGGISFDTTALGHNNNNNPIPTSVHSTIVAPFWDDLYTGGTVYYQTVGESPYREFIVEYKDINHYKLRAEAPQNPITFEIILYETTNEIKFQYFDVDFSSPPFNNGNSATVGIQKNSTYGLQYSSNTPSLSSGTAILFAKPVTKITTPANSGWYGPNTLPTISGTSNFGEAKNWTVEVSISSGTLYWKSGDVWDVGEAWHAAAGTTDWSYANPGWSTNGANYHVRSRVKIGTQPMGVSYSTQTFFYDSAPPTGLALTTPGNGDILDYNQPTFTWVTATDSGGSGLKEYYLKISTSADFNTLAINTKPVTNSYIPAPLPDATYYWKVGALDNVGNESWTNYYTLTIDTTAPSAPNLTEPEGNFVTNLTTPTFRWQAGTPADFSGIAGYRLQVDTEQSFTAPFTIDLSVKTTYYIVPYGVLTEATYYWQVNATDNAGNPPSPWSGVRQLIIDTTSPEKPTLTEKPDSPTNKKTAKFVYSSASPDCETYRHRLLLGTTTVENRTGWLTATTTTYFLSADGVYTFYVQAKDKAGNVSVETSYPWKIDSTIPNGPDLISPINNEQLIDGQPLFDWADSVDPTYGVAGYEIAVSTKPDFSRLLFHGSCLSTESFYRTPSTFTFTYGTYYWRVRYFRYINTVKNFSDWSKGQFRRNTPPQLVNSGNPGFVTDGVEPNLGDYKTNFVYQIKYYDEDGNPPAYVKIYIDTNGDGSPNGGDVWGVEMLAIGGNQIYQFNFNGFLDGDYPKYRFAASDGWAESITDWQNGPQVSQNKPPVITWVDGSYSGLNINVGTGYENYRIAPKYIINREVSFTYQVKYFDPENQAPGVIQISIDKNNDGIFEISGAAMTPLDGSTNYIAGVVYQYTCSGLKYGDTPVIKIMAQDSQGGQALEIAGGAGLAGPIIVPQAINFTDVSSLTAEQQTTNVTCQITAAAVSVKISTATIEYQISNVDPAVEDPAKWRSGAALVDGSTETRAIFKVSLPNGTDKFEEGSNNFIKWRVRGADDSLNWSDWKIVRIKYNTPPAVIILEPRNNGGAGTKPTIKARITDAEQGVAANSINLKITKSGQTILNKAAGSSSFQSDLLTYVWDGEPLAEGEYQLEVSAKDLGYAVPKEGAGTISFRVKSASIVDLVNYPSPFDPPARSLNIEYVLSQDSQVTINLYDMAKQLIKTVVDDSRRSSGTNTDYWDGRMYNSEMAANGIYFVELVIKDNVGEHRQYKPVAVLGK
ncbi:MAG: hypothetical protein ABII74_05975 [Elusimicrobiota bacterium]